MRISAIISKFYSEKMIRCIFIPESLKITDGMPSKLPRVKCLVLLKTGDVINDENFTDDAILSLELGGQTPFEHLELLSKSVLLPILNNPLNQLRWGDVNARELNGCFHLFLSSASVLCGQVKGETRLPIPPTDGDGELPGSLPSQNRNIPLLEAAIMTWTKQIKSILAQDPENL